MQQQLQPHQCQCEECKQPGSNATKHLHAQLNLFLALLTVQQRRMFLGLESKLRGSQGDQQLSLITGADKAVIVEGQRELEEVQLTGKKAPSNENMYKIKKTVAAQLPLPLTKKYDSKSRPAKPGK